MRLPRPPRWVLVTWVIVLALLIAGTVGLGVVDHRHDQTVAARQAAVDAVTEQLPEVLSYDYRTLEDDLARARANLNGQFKTEFTRLATRGIAPAARRKRVRTSARVTAAGVVRADTDDVVTLVFVTQTTRSAALPDPVIDSNRVRVTLTQVGERWLISALTPV